MAYDKSNLRAVEAGIVGAGPRLWLHSEASLTAAAFDASGYITDAKSMGMQVNDLVFHCNRATGIWSGHTVVTVNATTGVADLSNGTTIADGSSNSD